MFRIISPKELHQHQLETFFFCKKDITTKVFFTTSEKYIYICVCVSHKDVKEEQKGFINMFSRSLLPYVLHTTSIPNPDE